MKPGKIVYKGTSSKGKEIIIRCPTMDDLEIMCNFVNKLSKERTYLRMQGEVFPLEEEKRYLESCLKRIEEKKHLKLFAFSDNQLVGSSDIDMKDKIESHIGILGIMVDKDYRGEGIGKILMEQILNEAGKNIPQLRIVELRVYSLNKIAYEMYKKFGFVEHGVLPNGVYYKGEYIDLILMHKVIR